MMNHEKADAEFIDAFRSFHRQLSEESERGTVIVAVALIEDALTNILKARLCPSLDRDDELFGGCAPFREFATKIDLAYRIGLITKERRRTFHILRKLRNRFAHIGDEIRFSDSTVQDRLREIFRINQNLLSAFWEDVQEMKMEASLIEDKIDISAAIGSPINAFVELIGWRGLFDYFFALIAASVSLVHFEAIEPLTS
ncbi:MAG: hypothetical protein ACYC6G_02450 [Desulfobaccales bacterium]